MLCGPLGLCFSSSGIELHTQMGMVCSITSFCTTAFTNTGLIGPTGRGLQIPDLNHKDTELKDKHN